MINNGDVKQPTHEFNISEISIPESINVQNNAVAGHVESFP